MEWNGTEHNFSIPKKSGMEYRKTWNGIFIKNIFLMKTLMKY